MADSYTIDDAKWVRDRAHPVSFDFLMQELELGLIFCCIALAAHYLWHQFRASRYTKNLDIPYLVGS
jgi:hypothetical protein